jgi:spermidine synthase
VLVVLLFFSGAVALGYEVLWTRDFALAYGNTATATAIVLSVYFVGLALGAVLVDSLGTSRRPLRVYALLEAALVATILAYVALRPWLPAAAAWIAHAAPAPLLPLARIALAAAVLLLPTTLIGATLPVAAGATADHTGAARLYGWNTLGGAAGALATVFVLLPLFGMRRTYVVAAAVGLGLSEIARRMSHAPAGERRTTAARAASERSPRPRLAALVAGLAGAVALGAEVLWTRGLSGVLSSSVYSVALVLAATLLGIVVGTAAAVRVVRRGGSLVPPLAAAAAAGGIAVAASILALRVLPAMSLSLAQAFGATTASTGLIVEAILAVHVVFVPAACIGAILPLAVGLGDAASASRAIAVPLGANTAGGVIGALAAAFVLLPVLGLAGGLLSIAALLTALAAGLATRPALRLLAGGASAVLLVTAVVAPPLPFPWRAAPDDRVLLRRDGPTATVLVTEDSRGARRLRIIGQYSVGGRDGLLLERREALLPLLLHPQPRSLLHLGVGTGDTLGAALTSPGLTAVGVELVAEALDAAALFAAENGDVVHHPRARLVADDARSVLLSSTEHWDVILVDLLLPWTAGAGALFSREFYQLGRARLAPRGLLCHWLPLHQLRVDDLEAIVATFTAAFPHVQLWVAYHRSRTPLAALLGSAEPLGADAAAMRARLDDPTFGAMARTVGLDDPDDVGLLYVTDGAHLRDATRDVAPITDDLPGIEFSAPRGYFHQERLGPAALAWVAARLDPGPAPVRGARPAPFALRSNMLQAQLALVTDAGPAELRGYLDALALVPESHAVRQALAGIAAERRRAGDPATAEAISDAVSRAASGAVGDRRAP